MAEAKALDTGNFCGVTVDGRNRVVVQFNKGRYSQDEALRLAAWLVMGVEMSDPIRETEEILDVIRATVDAIKRA